MARRSGPRAGTIITIVALLALLLGGSGLLLAPHGAAEPSHAATPPPPGPAELSVAVLGVGGTPLPGVAVQALGTQGSRWAEGTTDGAGSVRFDSLPAAELSVILPGSRWFARTWPVTLVPGPNQLRIDLTEHAELTGRVSGLPQGEDGWDACLSNDLERTCVPIDETGRYVFTGIDVPEAGRYRREELGVDLEGQGARLLPHQPALLLSCGHQPGDQPEELALEGRHPFADGTGPGPHLEHGGREEAPAGKDPVAEVVQVAVAEGHQPVAGRGLRQRRAGTRRSPPSPRSSPGPRPTWLRSTSTPSGPTAWTTRRCWTSSSPPPPAASSAPSWTPREPARTPHTARACRPTSWPS